MSHTKSALIVLFSMGLILAALPTAARASEANKRTLMTINEPLALPGVVLSPGTYTFKLLTPVVDPDLVEVANAHDTHMVAMFMAVPDYRDVRTGHPAFQLAEQPKDDPLALKAWFFAGQHSGVEFLYPKGTPYLNPSTSS